MGHAACSPGREALGEGLQPDLARRKGKTWGNDFLSELSVFILKYGLGQMMPTSPGVHFLIPSECTMSKGLLSLPQEYNPMETQEH